MTGKSIIIVGMGPGNGRAIAERFGAEQYGIGLISRTAEKLEEQSDALKKLGFSVAFRAADTNNHDAVAAAIKALEDELGPIDVLLFNAYAASPELPTKLPPQTLADDLGVNVVAPLMAAQAVLPGMRERGSGAILLTGGGLALYPSMHAASLSIGKSAIRTLALVLHEELKGEGIRVGTVTIAGQVGSDIQPEDVARAFWAMSQERHGEHQPETVLKPQ